MQVCKILRILVLAPWLGLLGFSSAFAEAVNNREADAAKVEEYLNLHYVPWKDALRSHIKGDYVTLNGTPFFVKKLEITEDEGFSLALEINKRKNSNQEFLDLARNLAPQILNTLEPMVLQEYTSTASSSTIKEFTGFNDLLKGSTSSFNSKEEWINAKDKLVANIGNSREELKSQFPKYDSNYPFQYINNRLLDDLRANSSTLLTSAAFHFAFSGLSELVSSQIDEQLRTTYCYSSRPNGQNYILEIQAPNEQEQFLFKGINLYSRIKPKEFFGLVEQGCSKVGGKVIPERTMLSRTRDAFAFTVGKAAEISLDAAISMAGQHLTATKLLNRDWVLTEKLASNSDNGPFDVTFKIAPKAANGILAKTRNLIGGTISFGSKLGFGVSYMLVKQKIKLMVVEKYRKHFPKYNLKEVEPRELPLGIANVGKEFRYIYPNHENQECLLKPTTEKQLCEQDIL